MRQNHADFSGDKNPFTKWVKIPENKAKWITSLKKRHQAIRDDPTLNRERRERLSKQSAKAFQEGKLLSYGRGHESGYFKSARQNTKIYYRSSYELNFLKWCENSQNIFLFETNKDCILYDFDGMTKRYLPDFTINHNIVVEIKPKKLIENKQNKAKFCAAKAYYSKKNIQYFVLTEEELKDLNLWFSNKVLDSTP